LSHVPQTIYLSNRSIRENIAFGVPKTLIDDQRVIHVAKKATINKVIDSFDDGYNTKVGERGIRLSGGQRQRIGLARALYKASEVIVLDEATSALDSKTEANVMESIYSLGEEQTVFIVAHRLSTLKRCDLIVEIMGAKGVRITSYHELINKN
jgi:ATP-binding cassette subfamily B protein